jgi:uncharacterized delta-60 repeat protein
MQLTRGWVLVTALALVGAAGCELVTGLTGDAKLGNPHGGAGGTGTGGAGGTGTGGSSSTTSGGGGSGGQVVGSFAFAIKDASVNVPYGGLNYVNVEVTPSGGFSSAVDVVVQGAPAGLVTKPLTIPAGSTTGKLEVGAETTLVIGTTFDLKLGATSGAMTKTAMVPAVVTGKPGDLDQSFGGNGLVAGPTSTGLVNLNDIRELANGKILVGGLKAASSGAGTSIGLRLLSNGMPDTSFNATGAVTNTYCSCASGQGGTLSVAREVDGTLLFVGWGHPGSGTTDDIFLFRYDDSGAVYNIQGDNGVEDINLGGKEQVTTAVLVPNTTNVIVAGAKEDQLFVARIPDRLAGGYPDTTFAAPNGWSAPPVGGTTSSASAVNIDSAGRIVVAGWVTTASGDDLVLLRLTADGALDSSFGTTGLVTLARQGNQRGASVFVQSDGSILVAATTDEGSSRQLLVQRLLGSGAIDTAFGSQGAVLAPLGTTNNANVGGPTAWLTQMLDGRLLVAGNGSFGGVDGPVFVRLLANGSLDPTFGTGGEAAVYVGMQGAVRAMTLASDGKVLIAGSNGSNPGASFIARLWN